MERRKLYDFTFYFKESSVIMNYHNQYICFNNFSLRNKTNLHKFSDRIKSQRQVSLDEIYGLARQYNVPSIALSSDAAVRNSLKRVN